MASSPSIAQVDEPDDFGKGARANVARWISEINISEKDDKTAEWLKRGAIINRRYKDERKDAGNAPIINPRRRFAILWSNIETLEPAIYGQMPTAVVSRRFKDADPVGRMASEVLERAVNYSLEEGDFDALMKRLRKDYLLVGRGVPWVRYEPHMKPTRIPLTLVQAEVAEDGPQITDTVESYEDPTGKAYGKDDILTDDDGPHVMEDQVSYEKVCEDHVSWDNFLTNPCREWAEVRWVARQVFMMRDELIERFGEEIGKRVPLDWQPKGYDTGTPENDEQFKKAVVYEIWDKVSRKALWVSKGYTESVLDERDDPLSLEDFFPCPRPIYTTLGLDSLIPVPDYVFYQDQAEELDELTARIGKLVDALRMVGFYAGERKNALSQVFKPGNDNTLVPVEDFQSFKEGGGARGIIEWVPIDMVIQALTGCFEARQRIMEDIYQITGISDIMRGETDPDETATAQKLKGNFGAIRVRDRQKDVARIARDIIRLKGEIIASKFSIDTLKAMTGVQMLTMQEKQEAQAQIQAMQQQAQMTGQQPPPIPPELEEMLQRPSWEDVDQLLKNDAMRSFRIEIETDSTVEPNDTEQKQDAVEFLQAIGTYLANALPVVQAAPQMISVVMEGLKWVTRKFRVGREMEEVIDKAADQIMQAAQNPQQPAADPAEQAKAQEMQAKSQLEAQRLQLDAQETQAKLQGEQQDRDLEYQRMFAELQIEREKLNLEQDALKQEKHRLALETLGRIEDQNIAREANEKKSEPVN